jgi:hypothetical protein
MLLNTVVAGLFSLVAIRPAAVIIEKLLQSADQFAESIWAKASSFAFVMELR